MAKLEIERGPLVGGVLIAVSAAIAVALNTYSGYQAAPVVKDAAMQVQPSSEEDSACCEHAACGHAEPQIDTCATDVKRD